jgi:predicted dithiol-disulfide oxidoreductase (DUF899 family)
MSLPDIASREEWLGARRALLAEEKRLTQVGRAGAPRFARRAARYERLSTRRRSRLSYLLHVSRGTEQVGGTHYYLDMTALGLQEDWEEPRGRAGGGLASGAGWQ